MTNAIFFNHMRGSGRDVTVTLLEYGIEIVSMTKEPVAVWTYATIDLVKSTQPQEQAAFKVDHDSLNTLQVLDPASWHVIMQRSPLAQKTRRASEPGLWQIYGYIPEEAIIPLWMGATIAALSGMAGIYHWLF